MELIENDARKLAFSRLDAVAGKMIAPDREPAFRRTDHYICGAGGFSALVGTSITVFALKLVK